MLTPKRLKVLGQLRLEPQTPSERHLSIWAFYTPRPVPIRRFGLKFRVSTRDFQAYVSLPASLEPQAAVRASNAMTVYLRSRLPADVIARLTAATLTPNRKSADADACQWPGPTQIASSAK